MRFLPGEGFLLDYESIREDFPILSKKRIVYLDNAATTQKPRQVIEAVRRFYEESNANILRGIYELSMKATMLYEEAHIVVAKFIGARDWREVVFTKNSTDSINMIAYALIGRIKSGDNIVVTEMEHHSNFLPWVRLARLTGAELRVAPIDEHGRLDMEKLESLIDEKTRVVAIVHASNVLGVVNDVRRVARIAHQYDALVVVDAAQSVPHMPVNVRELEADFLVFSGHKMLGPTGIGVLWGRLDILEELEPPVYGGGAVKSVRVESGEVKVEYAELPWKWEPGTPNIAGAVGLAEAVRYLQGIGLEKIEAHERTLTRMLIKMLGELDVRMVGDIPAEERVGIVSFTLDGFKPLFVALRLGRMKIAVRAGFHCAEPLHRKLGFNEGSVRASMYLYNGPDDIEKLVDALRGILRGEGGS
ncbi:cysteine desulfurase, SufS subfamily [Pyrolobus fumarii 1A]|uniref:cysteine desulfurase n=1 Tax=Pyrolobus fumarii (strain DSM 11204 / 1A) TaxID=694429 RepID=G0ED22_PYRF1|nr:cysteine desulfurase [Pyrolobus fumarii]AEM38581.1 cysteine desulfurase, SufS subfamily [Pyrolobus fumarii 1A]